MYTHQRIATWLVLIFALSLSSISCDGTKKQEQSATPSPVTPQQKEAKAIKFCEGKYKRRDPFVEIIVAVECSSPTDECKCEKTGITCGTKSESAPLNTEFVEGSCKTTIVPNS